MQLKIVFLLATGLLLSYNGFGQGDSTLYVNGIPLPEDTSELVRFGDQFPLENHQLVSHGDLPSRLRKTLTKSVYRGWDQNPVYHDRNNDTYLITIKTKNSTRIIGFDRKGHPLTYDEKSPADQN